MTKITRICSDSQDSIKKLILQNNNFDIVLKDKTLFSFLTNGFVFPVTSYEYIFETLTYNQSITLFDNDSLSNKVKGVIIKVSYPLQADKNNVPIEKQYLSMEIFDDNLPSSPSMSNRQKLHNLYVNIMPPVDDTLLSNIGLINSIVLTNTHQEDYSIDVSVLLVK